jgi:serralysin
VQSSAIGCGSNACASSSACDIRAIVCRPNEGPPNCAEAFAFAANLGQATTANFDPTTDTIQFSKANFADTDALLAAIYNDGHGNAMITGAANDALTIEHVTVEQLHAHQPDFHII